MPFKLICLTFTILLSIKSQLNSQQKNSKSQSWIPKFVWTVWDKKIPDDWHYLKIFQYNRNSMLKSWQLRHADETNLQYWIKQTPRSQILNQAYFQHAQRKIKSQITRLILLEHFGGVYLDYSLAVIEPLDWILNVNDSPFLENKFGQKPDVVLMHNAYIGSKLTTFDPSTNKKFLINPTFQSFFIAAKPNALFIKDWLSLLLETRKQSYKKYGNDMKNTYALTIAQQQNIQIGRFISGQFQSELCAKIVLHRKQKQSEYDLVTDEKYREIPVKFYNIWSINAEKTAYGLHETAGYMGYKLMRNVFQMNREILRKTNVAPKYFIQFNKYNRLLLQKFFIKTDKVEFVKCPLNNYILENSYFYHFLLKDYPIKFLGNQIVKKVQDNKCWHINDGQFTEQISILNQKINDLQKKTEQNEKKIMQLVKRKGNIRISNETWYEKTYNWIILTLLLNLLILYYINKQLAKEQTHIIDQQESSRQHVANKQTHLTEI